MHLLLPTFLAVLHLVNAAPTTPHDAFRALSVTVPKPRENPVCCLRPLPPVPGEAPAEPDADELLLSFQEWKAKRAAAASVTYSDASLPPAQGVGARERIAPDAAAPATAVSARAPDDGGSEPALSPHFRVPLVDRFNFAALDCSARIHSSHKSARGASGILSGKKDRYMLSPCAASGQHVVVELCEDIRIDTVQLANFEFFSGVFRDLRVSAAPTLAGAEDGWTFVGEWRAKNVRGVQSFHPPPSLRGFYRYLRIEFRSHYGNEYYCPVSLLRVYGLTHLDEWKWETWAEEARARVARAEALPVVAAPEPEPEPKDAGAAGQEKPDAGAAKMPPAETHTSSLSTMASTPALTASTETTLATRTSRTSADAIGTSVFGYVESTSSPFPTTPAIHPSLSVVSPASGATTSPPSTQDASPSLSSKTRSVNASDAHTSPPSASSVLPTLVPVTTVVVASAAAVPPGQGAVHGESIYRTIMNRLAALEANGSLYGAFLDAQAASTRAALQRLAEDVGRLDGAARAYAASSKRALDDAERGRRELERGQERLARELAQLAGALRAERTLGLAQLILVLAVLVFVALTRGGAPPPPPARRVGTEPRRGLASSADWLWPARLRARSLTAAEHAATSGTARDASPTPAPAHETPKRGPLFLRRQSADAATALAMPLRFDAPASSRSRTPLARTPATGSGWKHHATAAAGAGGRTPLRAAHLSPSILGAVGASGGAPRSARRWARSAHIHELRSPRSPSRPRVAPGARTTLENTAPPSARADVFSAPPTPLPGLPGGVGADEKADRERGRATHPRRPLAPLRIDVPPPPDDVDTPDTQSDLSAVEDGEAWVDTDVDGSDIDGSRMRVRESEAV